MRLQNHILLPMTLVNLHKINVYFIPLYSKLPRRWNHRRGTGSGQICIRSPHPVPHFFLEAGIFRRTVFLIQLVYSVIRRTVRTFN